MASEKVQQVLNNPSMSAAMARNQASGAVFNSQKVRALANTKPIVDFDAVVWNENDSFIMPEREVFDATMFTASFRGNSFGAFLPMLENGMVKQLSFSKFTQVAQAYKLDDTTGEYVPDGPVVRNDTPFGVQCHSAGTQGKVIDLLEQQAGKRIKVTKVHEYMGAVRTQDDKGNSIIVGLRKQRLPFFGVEDVILA